MILTSEAEARDYLAARCTAASFALLERYVTALIEANQSQNLIARSSIPHIWLRHIADSAQLLDHVSRETQPWLDFGSGAGLPGLVVAAMQRDRRVILIESRRLRIEWLNEMIGKLGLANCTVAGGDARQVEALPAAVISARAFAPLPRLVALTARFSTNHTEWVLPKGRSAAQEVAALPPQARRMFHVKQSVTDAEAGIIVGKGRVEMAL